MNNLNQYLQPFNAPVTQMRNKTGYQFDTTSDRGMIIAAHLRNLSVTSAKINDFSFNSGTGGTLVLGGTNNVSGVFSLKNAAGSEVVGMNNNGINVTNGSITINNSFGTTIIDTGGVNSLSVFPISWIVGTTLATTSSTSYVDLPGSGIDIIAPRDTNFFLTFGAVGLNTGLASNGNFVAVGLYDSYTSSIRGNISLTGVLYAAETGIVAQDVNLSVLSLMAAGTHNLKLQFMVDGGQAYVYSYYLELYQMGQ